MRLLYAFGATTVLLAVAGTGCGTSNNAGLIDASDIGGGTTPGIDASALDDAGGTPTGVPMTCPSPGNPVHNGGSCGTERWNIKTGTDSQASSISLAPQPNTIAALVALPAASGGAVRESPTEKTVWELKDVLLTELKLESDSDYHLVISDGHKTMIAEVPYMSCTSSSAWPCFMSRTRAEIDARYTVTTSPKYPAATVTLRGVGFFDYAHNQVGVAANAIELHPILEICFGKSCTPS